MGARRPEATDAVLRDHGGASEVADAAGDRHRRVEALGEQQFDNVVGPQENAASIETYRPDGVGTLLFRPVQHGCQMQSNAIGQGMRVVAPLQDADDLATGIRLGHVQNGVGQFAEIFRLQPE